MTQKQGTRDQILGEYVLFGLRDLSEGDRAVCYLRCAEPRRNDAAVWAVGIPQHTWRREIRSSSLRFLLGGQGPK